MSQDEIAAVMRERQGNYELISRAEWEQTRLQCFYSATAFGGKMKQPKDLFKFPWDNERKKIEGPIQTRTKEEALAVLQELRKNRHGR